MPTAGTWRLFKTWYLLTREPGTPGLASVQKWASIQEYIITVLVYGCIYYVQYYVYTDTESKHAN